MEPTLSPGWYPDPSGRYEYRYHNGHRFTADVSVNGQRYVEPQSHLAPPGPIPPAYLGPRPPLVGGNRPSRGWAITAFVLGLCGVVLAWVPFVFVIAGAAAIVGLVFGILALRRIKSGEQTGKSLAVWGTVLSAVAIPLCVVGALFTAEVIDEIERLTEAGPISVEITSCSPSGDYVVAEGTITNLDSRYHDYTVTVLFVDDGVVVDSSAGWARDVAPGADASFDAIGWVGTRRVDCEVGSVDGFVP